MIAIPRSGACRRAAPLLNTVPPGAPPPHALMTRRRPVPWNHLLDQRLTPRDERPAGSWGRPNLERDLAPASPISRSAGTRRARRAASSLISRAPGAQTRELSGRSMIARVERRTRRSRRDAGSKRSVAGLDAIHLAVAQVSTEICALW